MSYYKDAEGKIYFIESDEFKYLLPVNSFPILDEEAFVQNSPTDFDIDNAKYLKRANVKESLIAWMAADNMSRVRAGMWTVENLTSLMADAQVKTVLDYMNTLSFELAAGAIQVMFNPLLTPEIKKAWVEKLQANYFNVQEGLANG